MNRFGYPAKRSSKKGVWATILSILALVFVVVGVCVLSVDTSTKITLNVLSNGETNSETIKFKGDTLTEEVLSEVLENDKVFSGWYYDDNYTQKAKVGDVVDGDLRLYSRQMSLIEGEYWERVENQLDLPEIGTTGGSSTHESPFSSGEGTGTGSAPYIITTSEDMGVFSRLINDTETDTYYLSANYKLANDIRLDTVDVMWPSVGSSARPFTGYFDGDNHMIYYIFGTKGVFNYVENATIQNIVVKGIKITATADNVGGLVSNALGETFISNCHMWGDISSPNGGVGGLVGEFSNSSTNYGTIQTSTIYTRVTGLTNVGGLVGKANNVVIQGCVNNGVIEATDTNNSNVSGVAGYANLLGLDHVINKGKITGKKYVGGVIGYQENNSLLAHNIINTGSINGTNYVGGIAGYTTDSVVTNSVNLGTVESGTSGDYVAGVIAYSAKGSVTPSISHSYSLGNIICKNSNTSHYDPIGFGDFTNGTKCGFNNIIKVGGKTIDSLNSNVTFDKGTNIYDGNPESEYTDILNTLSSKIGYSNYSDTSSGVSWNITYPWKTNIFDFSGRFPTISDNSDLNEITYQAKYYVNGTLKYVIYYTADEPVLEPQTRNTIEWFADEAFTTKYVFGSTISSTISIYGKQEVPKPKYTISLVSNKSGVTLSPNNYKVEEGGTYTGKITNNSGFDITSVTVVMSDTENPTFTYDASTGTITITNVTGNTQITPVFSSTEITYHTVTLQTDLPGVSLPTKYQTAKSGAQYTCRISSLSSRTITSCIVKMNGKTLTYGVDYSFEWLVYDITIFKVTGDVVLIPIYNKSGSEYPSTPAEIKSLHPWLLTSIVNYGELGTDSNGEKVWKVGDTEWFHIGDETGIRLTDNQVLRIAIADFNHDVDSNGKAIPITFVGLNLLKDPKAMKADGTDTGGWAESDMRTYLNSDIWDLIPIYWQQIINPAVKYSNIGDGKTDVASSEDNLFLLSFTEIGGVANDSANDAIYNKEGTKYPIFEDDYSRARDFLDSEGNVDEESKWSVEGYWIRSAYVPNYDWTEENGKGPYMVVDHFRGGVADDNKAYRADSLLGVCPAFCVGIDPTNPYNEVKPLSECTPEEILEIGCMGTLGTDSNGEKVWKIGQNEWFHIGDETTIELTDGQTLKIAIADFNHDVGLDGTSILPFTFVSMNLLSQAYQMNTGESNLYGWRDSKLRSNLNSTIWNLIPDEWREVINPAIKKTSMGNAGSTIFKSEDNLFLLSVSEVGLTSSDSSSATVYNNEGTQYPIFSDNNSRVRYTLKSTGENDSALWWWLRSPLPTDTTKFQYIKIDGSMDSDTAYMPYYLCFAFCVGMESANYTVRLETPNSNITLSPDNPHIAEGGDYLGTIVNQTSYVIENILVSMGGDTTPEYTFDPITLKVEIKKLFGDVTITPIIKCVVSLDKSVSGISISPEGEGIEMGSRYEGKITNTSGKEIAGFEICVDNSYYLVRDIDYSYDSATNTLTINKIQGNTVIKPLFNSSIGIPTEVSNIKSLTPEQIRKIASAGKLGTDADGNKVWKVGQKEWFHIGDMTVIKLTDGQLLYIAIADFNHDVGSDGTTVLPFTFVGMNLLKDKYKMNTTGTNSGGWASSGMRTYLNSTIWDLFPAEWQAVIDPAKKMSTVGGKSTSVSSSDNNLFILSYTEVAYEDSTQTGQTHEQNYYSKEGTVYPIFSDNASRYRPYLYDPYYPYALIWWLRSPTPDSTSNFAFACSGLGAGSSWAASAEHGVCPAFCIGADEIEGIEKKSLSECTPDEIMEIANNGSLGTDSNGDKVWIYNNEEWFHVGDETTITLTDGQEIRFALADFNHDVGSDGTTVMPFTFVAMDLLNDERTMKSSSANDGGWANTEMKWYLDYTILNLFPTDWMKIMATTSKKSTIGGTSTTVTSSTSKLWLLSESEVGLSTSSPWCDEGTLYPIFSNSESRIRKFASDTAGQWWLRSTDTRYVEHFLCVNVNGGWKYNTSIASVGILPAFCVSGEENYYYTVSLLTDQTGVTLTPNNHKIPVDANGTYTGTIVNSNGSIMPNISVEMDGTTSPSFTYNYINGTMTIPNVTGDVKITPIFRDSDVKLLSSSTPAEIETIANSGKLGTDEYGNTCWIYNEKPYFYIGDKTTITLTDNQSLTVALADFNHDVGEDGTTVLKFTFVAVNILKTSHRMNAASSNAGGWKESEMRTYLNSTILNLFPTEWSNIIKSATKGSTKGEEDTTITTSTGKLWLPSVSEVGLSTESPHTEEGTLYPLFSDAVDRKKNDTSDSINEWWLRSPGNAIHDYFALVNNKGRLSYTFADRAYGVVPAFCVGAKQPVSKGTISGYTPEEILYIAEHGELGTDSSGNKVWKYDGEEVFHIGDDLTINLTDGQMFRFAIADFNHDVGEDGTTIMPITFTATSVLDDYKIMNTTSITNVGGWRDSGMRTYLNETIWNLFPDDWKAVIATTQKVTTAGNQSTDLVTTNDKLFLFSLHEVGLSVDDKYDTAYYNNEGTPYPIFTSDVASYKRYKLDENGDFTGNACNYWLRSPTSFDSTSFHLVFSNGKRGQLDSNYLLGVCPVFTVGTIGSSSNVKALADCTPSEIKEIASNGSLGTDSSGNKVWIYEDEEWFHIGDTTSITLSDGQIFKIAIADFNHDVGSSGATLPFTFVGMNVLKDTQGMNTTSKNSGGWASSNMKTYLNSTIWNLFPSDWQAIITPTKKISTTGNSSSGTSSATTNLFLLSFTEVGHTSSSYDSSHYTKEGTLYPIFTDSTSRLRYTLDSDGNNATAQWWWLRSPVANNSMGFAYVSNTGIYMSGYNRSADGNFYVCPGFCV